MSKLSIKTKMTHHIDWLTYAHVRERGEVGLEGLVAETYGVPIEMGSSNDTDYSCHVQKEEFADYDKKDMDDIIEQKFFEDYQLNLVMNDLCNRGVIEPGDYVVTMSW